MHKRFTVDNSKSKLLAFKFATPHFCVGFGHMHSTDKSIIELKITCSAFYEVIINFSL